MDLIAGVDEAPAPFIDTRGHLVEHASMQNPFHLDDRAFAGRHRSECSSLVALICERRQRIEVRA